MESDGRVLIFTPCCLVERGKSLSFHRRRHNLSWVALHFQPSNIFVVTDKLNPPPYFLLPQTRIAIFTKGICKWCWYLSFKTYFLPEDFQDISFQPWPCIQSNVSTNAKVPLTDTWTLWIYWHQNYISINYLWLFFPSKLYTLKATWNLAPRLKW